MKNAKKHTEFDKLLGLGAYYSDKERKEIHSSMDSTAKKHPGRKHRKDKVHKLFGK